MQRSMCFILGASKCGTYTLYRYLERHPEVCVSRPKEPHFFEYEFEHGLDYYFDRYYGHWNGERVRGDARVAHFHLPYVPPRIRQCFPDARLIAILRNPVERAYSHWWMNYSQGSERLPFAQAIGLNAERLQNGPRFEDGQAEEIWRAYIERAHDDPGVRHYLDAGRYALCLRHYLEHFPADQLKIILTENLQQRPGQTYKTICEHLAIRTDAIPPETIVHQPAWPAFLTPLTRFYYGRRLNRYVPVCLGARARSLVTKMGNPPRMDAATRQWLIEFYRPHNATLAALLDRDLTHWDAS